MYGYWDDGYWKRWDEKSDMTVYAIVRNSDGFFLACDDEITIEWREYIGLAHFIGTMDQAVYILNTNGIKDIATIVNVDLIR